jgi:hypothetical protein
MIHSASPTFWELYNGLPDAIRELADNNFALLKEDPAHPSLHFKKVGRFRSARVVRNYYLRKLDNWTRGAKVKNETRFGSFEELMEMASPHVRPILNAARAKLFELKQDSVEVVRLGEKTAIYGVGPSKMKEAFAYLMPCKTHLNLGFYHADQIKDPKCILEGSGKKLRHIKLKGIESVESEAIITLIRASIENRLATLNSP